MLFSNQHFGLITRQVATITATARRNERMAGEEGEQIHLQQCVVFQCTLCKMVCAISRPDEVRKMVAAEMCLVQWRTQDFFSGGGGSTNSVEDREDGDLGAVVP